MELFADVTFREQLTFFRCPEQRRNGRRQRCDAGGSCIQTPALDEIRESTGFTGLHAFCTVIVERVEKMAYIVPN
jgi:hypothetical protein